MGGERRRAARTSDARTRPMPARVTIRTLASPVTPDPLAYLRLSRQHSPLPTRPTALTPGQRLPRFTLDPSYIKFSIWGASRDRANSPDRLARSRRMTTPAIADRYTGPPDAAPTCMGRPSARDPAYFLTSRWSLSILLRRCNAVADGPAGTIRVHMSLGHKGRAPGLGGRRLQALEAGDRAQLQTGMRIVAASRGQRSDRGQCEVP
jgi:hypothetical protein